MIRHTSIQQALSLRGTIPELAVIRSIQFMGDGYSPEEHGHIIVVQADEDFAELTEIDSFTEDCCEYIEAFIEGDHIVYESVFQIDNSKTIAVIIPDEPWLGEPFRKILRQARTPQPLPTPKRSTPLRRSKRRSVSKNYGLTISLIHLSPLDKSQLSKTAVHFCLV